MFYKFATTAGGVYPSDAAAHKAAALEIVAMNAIVGANNTQLTVSLTALYKFSGFCVIATAKAPLGKRSLVYGCDNAGHGRDIESGQRCPSVVPLIRGLASTLGLAEHAVADGAGREVLLCLPIDTEVHVGSDDRVYLIDLARLMPPVPPPPGDRTNSYLYRHLRPEFLRRYANLQLSSDAFSFFAAAGPSRAAAEAAGECARRHRPGERASRSRSDSPRCV